MTDQGDDANREAARRLFDRTRGARERARKGEETVDTQKSVTETVADATKTAVKRLAGAVQDEGKAAGAEFHQIAMSAG